MNFRLLACVLLAFIGLHIAEPVWSHTKVKTSTLEDGKTYQDLPEMIDLVFAQKVGLITLILETQDGSDIPLNFDKPKGMHSSFAIPKPDLKTGGYVLHWRVMAKDGHVLSGKITFTYEP